MELQVLWICIPSVSVALATSLVSFSLRLVLLFPRVFPVPSGCLVYAPVPKETMHWMGVLLPHRSLASCRAMAQGLLVSRPPSYTGGKVM